MSQGFDRAAEVRGRDGASALKEVWSRFGDLSGREVHDLLKLRQDIFVVEQECPYPDIDGKDLETLHFRLLDSVSGHLAGACRVFLPEGDESSNPEQGQMSRIGRVVIDSAYRGQGLGRLLMRASLEKLDELAPQANIVLGAQAHLQEFYASFGFERCSEDYLEDGILHLDMIKRR